MNFTDLVKINVFGGKGGDGVTSFRRQPYEPKGPPEGGDGGDGGDVVIEADGGLSTLIDFHYRPHRRAAGGVNGSGDLRHGARGADELLRVPVGTVVRDEETDEVLGDLTVNGQQLIVAEGGRGGRGNAAFRTRQRRAPRFHEYGATGGERWVVLELKLMADVALVGFPNGGKSSLIGRLSAARPKIADYAFTTLAPNLGVVTVDNSDFVVADVPGLIEGASDGRGLGHEFLRHVERAGALVHVLDCASGYAAADDTAERRYEQRIPTDDLEMVVQELRAYMPELVDRPAIVWLNKADVDPDMAELVRPELEEAGWEVLTGSAVTGEGIDALKYRLADLVAQSRAERAQEALETLGSSPDGGEPVERPVLRPRQSRSGPDFDIERVGLGGDEVGWRVHSDRLERWVSQLDLSNDDAVDYLQGRLKRAGLEDALEKAGATAGDDVEIAGSVFVFKPDDWVPDEDDWGDPEAPDAIVDVEDPDGPVAIDLDSRE